MGEREMICHYYSNAVLSTLIVLLRSSSSPCLDFTLSFLTLSHCLSPCKWISYTGYQDKHLRGFFIRWVIFSELVFKCCFLCCYESVSLNCFPFSNNIIFGLMCNLRTLSKIAKTFFQSLLSDFLFLFIYLSERLLLE